MPKAKFVRVNITGSKEPQFLGTYSSKGFRQETTAPVVRQPEAFTPTLYDAMIEAVGHCFCVDECKEISDTMRAYEIYARQAANRTVERRARAIRIRAARRCGELLLDMERQQGERTDLTSPPMAEKSQYAAALEKSGISTQTASRFQRLAIIPKDDFENALADPENAPSTSALLRSSKPVTEPVPGEVKRDPLIRRRHHENKTTWAVRIADQFREMGIETTDARTIVANATPEQLTTIRASAPAIAQFFKELSEASASVIPASDSDTRN